MIIIRKAKDRGYFKNEWLSSFHTFSFGEYFDPKHMHFHHLRVINEDYIAADQGFPAHSHQNMEIMTYIISGELAHEDDMGNHSVIKSGEVQFMRAGKNVVHSEFNPSTITPTHLLQIWIIPNEKELTPTYSQTFYSLADKRNKFCLLADNKGTSGVFRIAQNVAIYSSILEKPSALSYPIEPTAHVWVQLVQGTLQLNDTHLVAGDGVGIHQETQLMFSTDDTGEFLLFHFGVLS
jgi:redox-sensitive bicupin YhaK (pirin superfamily)